MAILCYVNKNFVARSKVENGRTKLIVLGQIVLTLFKSHFIHCYDQSAVNLHVPKINFSISSVK